METRPSPSAFLSNLRAPMALGGKLRSVLGNTWTKIKTRSNCCGNFGEPGC